MMNPQRPTTDNDGMPTPYNPETPQKVDRSHHGLSLHMPQKLLGNKPTPPYNRLPLSPKLDSSETFGSPASVLPRRSRGLDFSRACTNLHHSTLAESSPDSSPIVGARGVSIPQRRAGGLSMVGSPGTAQYGGNSGHGQHERSAMSGSVSSINMLDSDESSCSDDDDDESINAFERDAILTTPQRGGPGPNGLSTPLAANPNQSPGGDWMSNFSAAKSSLLSFQRGRFKMGRSKHSSNNGSGSNSKQNSSSMDSPLFKSLDKSSASYFPKVAPKINTKSILGGFGQSRNETHVSDASDDGEGGRQANVSSPSSGSLAGGSNSESGRRGVIRRAVTRRGNLLPKTKNFARIRAALFEEGAPIESEAKREADVIKQVRESDNPEPPLSPTLISSTMTAGNNAADGTADTFDTTPSTARRPSTSFRRQMTQNSGGIEFWNSFDNRYRTPPPSGAGDSIMSTPSRNGSVAQTDDIGADGRGQPSQKKGEIIPNPNKRRRPDDFDLTSFKRRAVSPVTSSQNSPVQPHAPSTLENARSKAISIPGSHSSESATPATSHSGPVKRVGLQGMKETNDGLMNMSID